jgi:hypothetical protein
LSQPAEQPVLGAATTVTAESCIWAGIHYRSGIVAGRQLAVAVANKVIEPAKQMGGEP